MFTKKGIHCDSHDFGKIKTCKWSKMESSLLKKLYVAVNRAKDDIKEIGGSEFLRGNLGVEHHFKWRVMYHLESKLSNELLQSPEVKFPFNPNKKYDLVILKDKDPLIIAEFKMTWFSMLKKEVSNEFPKLILAIRYFLKTREIQPFFGLVYYLEKKQDVFLNDFMAKKESKESFFNNQDVINWYFEFVVVEKDDKVLTFPDNLLKENF